MSDDSLFSIRPATRSKSRNQELITGTLIHRMERASTTGGGQQEATRCELYSF
jgi:hypothetical protein